MSAKPREGNHNLDDERKPRAVQQAQPRPSYGRDDSREVKLATKVPRKKRYDKFKGKNDDPSCSRKRVKQSNDLRDQSSRTKSDLAKATPEENPQPTRRVSVHESLHDFSKFNPYPTKFETWNGKLLPSLRWKLRFPGRTILYPGYSSDYESVADKSYCDIPSYNDRRNPETGSSPDSSLDRFDY